MGTRTMPVPGAAPGAGAFAPTAVSDTLCVELACPGAGIFAVTAYASWPTTGEKSGPIPWE